MTDPLRARLTALVAEMHDRILPPEIESDTEYWAGRIDALLRESPAGPACIACGEDHDGGYEVEDGPGPFCAGCWERLQDHFAVRLKLPEKANA
jgi:hypothetical protein